MSITDDIRDTIAIYCDDHVDVDRDENDCFIEMQDCEYSCTITMEEQIQRIVDDVKQFDVDIVLVEFREKYDGFDVSIHVKMSDWLAYQDEIMKKHDRYIRRKMGLPLGPRPNKKNYHRIIKRGFCAKTHKQRYQILGCDGEVIKSSVDRQKLEKELEILRSNEWPWYILRRRSMLRRRK